MNVTPIEGTGDIVVEPDWTQTFNDPLEIASAREHWRVITTELRDRNLLAPSNAHAIQRLVEDYLFHDRATRDVAENGAVTKPRRGNTKAIARLSPHFTARREMGSDAATLEAELGLSPRRRAAATKVEKRARATRAADQFLKPVAR